MNCRLWIIYTNYIPTQQTCYQLQKYFSWEITFMVCAGVPRKSWHKLLPLLHTCRYRGLLKRLSLAPVHIMLNPQIDVWFPPKIKRHVAAVLVWVDCEMCEGFPRENPQMVQQTSRERLSLVTPQKNPTRTYLRQGGVKEWGCGCVFCFKYWYCWWFRNPANHLLLSLK